MKLLILSLLLCISLAATGCGGSTTASPQSGSLSGNWQISLNRHVNPVPPLVYTGFLVQSGNNISGNIMFNLAAIGTGLCQGVGTVTGTVSQPNVSLTISELGEDISLNGTVSPSSTIPGATTPPMTGEFSNLAGGCTNYSNSGTWTATSIAPLAGSFHGTFTSTALPSNGTFDVTGTLNQGANTGGATATLSGTINAANTPSFCAYISSATIGGLISGTAVSLNLYGSNGTQIAQIGQLGNQPTVTVTPDGKSISGTYLFPAISKSCSGDQGTLQITFP